MQQIKKTTKQNLIYMSHNFVEQNWAYVNNSCIKNQVCCCKLCIFIGASSEIYRIVKNFRIIKFNNIYVVAVVTNATQTMFFIFPNINNVTSTYKKNLLQKIHLHASIIRKTSHLFSFLRHGISVWLFY